LGLADFSSSVARDDVAATVLSMLEALLPQQDDAAYRATTAARAAFLLALQAQSFGNVARDLVRPVPSTVLAFDFSVDEAVFLERNAVRHPLFVGGRVYV